jgi:hypothetical protein
MPPMAATNKCLAQISKAGAGVRATKGDISLKLVLNDRQAETSSDNDHPLPHVVDIVKWPPEFGPVD